MTLPVPRNDDITLFLTFPQGDIAVSTRKEYSVHYNAPSPRRVAYSSLFQDTANKTYYLWGPRLLKSCLGQSDWPRSFAPSMSYLRGLRAKGTDLCLPVAHSLHRALTGTFLRQGKSLLQSSLGSGSCTFLNPSALKQSKPILPHYGNTLGKPRRSKIFSSFLPKDSAGYICPCNKPNMLPLALQTRLSL